MRCPSCHSYLRYMNRKIGLMECTQKGCSCIVQHISLKEDLLKEKKKKEVLHTFIEEERVRN